MGGIIVYYRSMLLSILFIFPFDSYAVPQKQYKDVGFIRTCISPDFWCQVGVEITASFTINYAGMLLYQVVKDRSILSDCDNEKKIRKGIITSTTFLTAQYAQQNIRVNNIELPNAVHAITGVIGYTLAVLMPKGNSSKKD